MKLRRESIFLTLDVLMASGLLVNSVGGFLREYASADEAETGLFVPVAVLSLYGIPSALALFAAVAMWRNWRRRWLIQFTLGMCPPVMLVLMYVVPLFIDLRDLAR
jgi:hypothetical protein